MYLLLYSDQALEDLLSIKTYLEEESGSESIAREFTKTLLYRCEWIARFPGSPGRLRQEIGLGIFSFVHDGYIIFFHYEETLGKIVKILTIVEGHRDIESLFSNNR